MKKCLLQVKIYDIGIGFFQHMNTSANTNGSFFCFVFKVSLHLSLLIGKESKEKHEKQKNNNHKSHAFFSFFSVDQSSVGDTRIQIQPQLKFRKETYTTRVGSRMSHFLLNRCLSDSIEQINGLHMSLIMVRLMPSLKKQIETSA